MESNKINNLVDEAITRCTEEILKFRTDEQKLIIGLIEAQLFTELTDIFFKQGFVKGMKFSSDMRDNLTTSNNGK